MPKAVLARQLAPFLYLQRDEWFPLVRLVAVVHPSRPVIAYHLLRRDDAHLPGFLSRYPRIRNWCRWDMTSMALQPICGCTGMGAFYTPTGHERVR